VVCIAYLLASIFLSVFSFSSTTILHCFIVDEEVKGGRRPESLIPFIEANEKINQNKANKGKAAAKDEPKDDKAPNNV
jgi:hypothetical protein